MPTENHGLGTDDLVGDLQADATAAGQVVHDANTNSRISEVVREARERASGQQ